MNIHVVDSKKTTLSAEDILLVAANEFKEGLSQYEADAEKSGVSPLRAQYETIKQLYSHPKYIRLREGNTLAIIIPLTGKTGMVYTFNADTATNYVDNIVSFFKAASKFGYGAVLAQIHSEEMQRILSLAAKKAQKQGVGVEVKAFGQITAIKLLSREA